MAGLARCSAILVVGCGRSGTHWLGHILNSHPDIGATIEKPGILGTVTRMAMAPNDVARLLPVLQRLYQEEIERAAPRHYADKSHPSLWIADLLAEVFPSFVFIGIERGPFAAVASMIRHRAVTEWTTKWRQYPVPNRFLGITEENVATYDGLSVATKHALRWRAHADRMAELRRTLGRRMHFLTYESLHTETGYQMRRLACFLALDKAFPPPEIRRRSLGRWREDLTEKQVVDVARIVGYMPTPPAMGSDRCERRSLERIGVGS